MRKASWILLTVVGSLWLFATLASSSIAYFQPENLGIAGKRLSAHGLSDELQAGIRGQRGTAAAYGTAFVTLFLFIVTGPYRRGETWAWWALLTSTLALLLLTLLRVPTLHTKLGVGAAAIAFGLTLLGLLLDVGRLKRT